MQIHLIIIISFDNWPQMGENPIGSRGAQVILDAINNERSVLNHLDLTASASSMAICHSVVLTYRRLYPCVI